MGVANRVLRESALTEGWLMISNDNVRVFDLSDNVHLNAAGTVRVHRNIVIALRTIVA